MIRSRNAILAGGGTRLGFDWLTFCRVLDHELEHQTSLLLPISMCSSDGLAIVRRVGKFGYLEKHTWRSWRKVGLVGNRLEDRVDLPDVG